MSWRARLSQNLVEIKWIFSPSNPKSAGLQNFISANYGELKRLNPTLPMQIRSRQNFPTQMVATYDYGGEALRDLDGLEEDRISEIVQELSLLGEHSIKADTLKWQDRAKSDLPSVPYEAIKDRGF